MQFVCQPCLKEQPVKVCELVNFNWPLFWIGLWPLVCAILILLSIENEVLLDRLLYYRFFSYLPIPYFWANSEIFRCTKNHVLFYYEHTRKLTYLFLIVQEFKGEGETLWIPCIIVFSFEQPLTICSRTRIVLISWSCEDHLFSCLVLVNKY